jgi:sulfur carrier protein
MEVPDGTVVRELIDTLEILHHEIAILLVNGRDASLKHELRDGDAISVFPPVGGG